MSIRKIPPTLVGIMLAVFLGQGWMAVKAHAAEIKLTILAMGDSYTAGTGGLDYFGASGCYRSENSYGQRLADRIREDSDMEVEFSNVACHGAVVEDLDEQAKILTERERMSVDLVLLTIGGNDGGFSRIVKQCFVPGLRDAIDCATELARSTGLVSDIKTDIYRKLVELEELLPHAHFVLVGYPYMVDDGPNGCVYLLETAGNTVKAGSAVRELADKFERAQKQVIDRLNGEHEGRFELASIHSHFAGHENCGTKALWLRGSFDTLIVNEWWHPNTEGYRSIGNKLYALKVAVGQADVFRYGRLPLACGVVVSFASTYGMSGNAHGLALDLPMPSGTKVVAPASGRAIVRYSPSYGNYVDIVGTDGVTYRMAHLQSTGLVANGSRVVKGQKIGLVGSTGTATGPHIHYEQLKNGQRVTIKLDGPRLEWGPNLNASGSRRTTHTLESANSCK